MDKLQSILTTALNNLQSVSNLQELEQIRVEYLGKNGVITAYLKLLGTFEAEARKSAGALINEVKNQLAEALERKKEQLDQQLLAEKLQKERIDITLPTRQQQQGSIHPISYAVDELVSIFGTMGFKMAQGPEIEDDFHNFTALNIPAHHPARQMQDSFYLPEGMLLRTHTSSVQIRAMQNGKPPFRLISAGRTYRCDSDMTHTPMFHQLEALCIDKNINMGHLKGCVIEFLKKFFETDEVVIRFRPSFFPFVEPGAEVDISCSRKNGEITLGKGDDWLEIMGCGMVHPNVLRNVGVDPNEYQGFALGMGIERAAMLKYGIADLRQFFEGDARWINHYSFNSFDMLRA
jgi:phenylalanyl-tRNA synthetase alpha chain